MAFLSILFLSTLKIFFNIYLNSSRRYSYECETVTQLSVIYIYYMHIWMFIKVNITLNLLKFQDRTLTHTN